MLVEPLTAPLPNEGHLICDFDHCSGDRVVINYVDQVRCRDAYAYGVVRDTCFLNREKYYFVATVDGALRNCGIQPIAEDESGLGIGIFHPDELEPYRQLVGLIVDNEGIS